MGGKRKTKKKVVSKKKVTVPKQFKCPFCNHEGSCDVKLDRGAETGAIACRVCGESYQCRITYLSAPVDVFCDWIDELERLRGAGGAAAAGGDAAAVAAAPAAGAAAASAAVAAAAADFLDALADED